MHPERPVLPSAEHTPRWLTTSDVAAQIQVNVKVVYRAVQRGQLRAATVANGFRFKQEWVDQWVEACATPVNPMAIELMREGGKRR
jgi:excisionase family DNA binding protein